MAVPAERLPRHQGLVQPLRLTEGITRGELADILRDAAAEARGLILRNTVAAGGIEAARLESMASGLGGLSDRMWQQVGTEIRQGIRQAARLSASQEIERLRRLGLPGSSLRQFGDDMYFVATQAADDIISRRTNGLRLADRIYRNARGSVLEAGKIIESGLARQVSARSLARSVAGLFRPDVRGGVSYAAMRLARTEINNAHHDTTIRIAKDNPWTQGFKWNLSGSHPRPDICNSYAEDDNGLGAGVYRVGDAPSKPHPQCLCYLTVIQPSRAEFLQQLISGKYDDRIPRSPSLLAE